MKQGNCPCDRDDAGTGCRIRIPVAGMAGITGLLYQQFAITIVVSVLVSSRKCIDIEPGTVFALC